MKLMAITHLGKSPVGKIQKREQQELDAPWTQDECSLYGALSLQSA